MIDKLRLIGLIRLRAPEYNATPSCANLMVYLLAYYIGDRDGIILIKRDCSTLDTSQTLSLCNLSSSCFDFRSVLFAYLNPVVYFTFANSHV